MNKSVRCFFTFFLNVLPFSESGGLEVSALCCLCLRTALSAHDHFSVSTNLYDKPLTEASPTKSASYHFHNKVCVWEEEEITKVSGRQNEKIEEGDECHETAQHFSLLLPLCFLLASVCSVLATSAQTLCLSSCHPQMNSMNSVSSSEDIKPPPGLQNLGNINYQCPSPGGMSKHICAICGDRSSGNVGGRGGGETLSTNISTQIAEGQMAQTNRCQAY